MAVGADAVRIDGLRELSRALKSVEDGLQKDIGPVLKGAAAGVAARARGKINSQTGRLAASIRPYGTQRTAGVRMGSAAVRYAGPWEFGGYPAGRPFIAEGRALYPTFREQAPQVSRDIVNGLEALIRQNELG